MARSSPSVLMYAERLAAALPPLLLQAHKMADVVWQGAHARRRAGVGDDFWQFRPFGLGDLAHRIDWRQSARTDKLLVRDREFAAPQQLRLWVDRSPSMNYASRPTLPTKQEVATMLGLALAILALRAGEQVVWDAGGGQTTKLWGTGGLAQLTEISNREINGLDNQVDVLHQEISDARGCPVLISDFLWDKNKLRDFVQLNPSSEKGVLIHIADPLEEDFSLSGRLEVEGMEGEAPVLMADGLSVAGAYHQKWQAHCAELADLAQHYGWYYVRCNTGRDRFDDVLRRVHAHLAGQAKA